MGHAIKITLGLLVSWLVSKGVLSDSVVDAFRQNDEAMKWAYEVALALAFALAAYLGTIMKFVQEITTLLLQLAKRKIEKELSDDESEADDEHGPGE